MIPVAWWKPPKATRSRRQSDASTRYVYRWAALDRKGQQCQVLARGSMNSVLLHFDDGFTVVTSANSIRRANV